MKGYKAFDKGFVGHGGFQYEIGKEYAVEGKLEMRKNGFHFCKNLIDVFEHYPCNEDTVFAEVEGGGEIKQEGTIFCAERIAILREVSRDKVDKITESNRKKGDLNSGNYNSGNYNTGNYNSGDYNSGWHNSGDYNSGDHNSGDYNSGDHNSGDYNSGDHNSGDCNTGNYNSGDYNSGIFNSDTPTLRMFNKDSGMTIREFIRLKIAWDDLNKSKKIIKSLPNYDAQIFYKATGIDWRDDEDVAR